MKELCCKNCDGKLKVNISAGIASCPFCGTAYVLDEVQTNSRANMLADIRKLAESGDEKTCEKLLKKFQRKYPADYEGYWEEVLYLTDGLKITTLTLMYDFASMEEIAEKALRLAPDNIREKLQDAWSEFKSEFFQKRTRAEKIAEQKIEKEREENIKRIAKDLKQLSGVYFGHISYDSSKLQWEGGCLMLDAVVRNGQYISEKEVLEGSLPREKVEVYLDEEGFFMTRLWRNRRVYEKQEKKFLCFRWKETVSHVQRECVERPLFMDGKKVRLHKLYEPSFKNDRYFAVFYIGDEEIMCLYRNYEM